MTSDTSAHIEPVDALPVRLEASDPHAGEMRRWVESVVGWQVVQTTDVEGASGLSARVVLRDVDTRPRAGGSLPVVLLVRRSDHPAAAARAGATCDAVLRWPDEREHLGELVAGLLPGRSHATSGPHITVGGAAGGVGATTVAMALGGLAAWQGGRGLVVRAAPPWQDPRGDGRVAALLEGASAWDAGSDVPGVPGLRRLDLPREHVHAELRTDALTVIRDVGVDPAADVLVVRRDRAGLLALERCGAAVAVLVDVGPAPPAHMARSASTRRLVRVPWSARVARAGLRDRVPAGLPGSWLRRLVPLVRGATPAAAVDAGNGGRR